jgi:hypothetical protein
MNRTFKTAVAAPQLHGEGPPMTAPQPQYVHLARGWTRKDIRELRIFEKGWNAAQDGRARDQNPFSQKWSRERRNAWDDGYRCFQQAKRGQLAEFEFARDQNARHEAWETSGKPMAYSLKGAPRTYLLRGPDCLRLWAFHFFCGTDGLVPPTRCWWAFI